MSRETWFFLRGLVRESGHWADFLSRFSAAFPERKMIPLDLPGTGRNFQERCPASIPAMASRLRKDFLREKGEKNYFFAISLGAMVGLEWMQEHPADFNGGIFVNTSMRGLNPFYQRLLPANYGKILRLFASADPFKRERTILAMTSHRSSLHPRLAQEWAEIAKKHPVSKGNALRQLLAAMRFSPPRERPRPNLLLLSSLGDRLCSPHCSEKISRHWNLELKTHPSAGHDLTLDDPDWVIEAIRAFPT